MRKGLIFISSLILTACSITPNMVAMSDVDNKDWSEAAQLTYTNSSIEQCDMSIVIHVNHSFAMEELPLQITMFTPDSLRYTEQVVLPVKHQQLRPTTIAADIELPYREDVHLRCKGEYTWHITPSQNITGVEAVGIKFHAKN